MGELRDLLRRAAVEAASYRESVGERPVGRPADLDALRAAFGGRLPRDPTPASEVLTQLVTAAAGGLVATVGPRFFGFVISNQFKT